MISALNRYRILAYATGVFLLLLTAHVLIKFVQVGTEHISYGEASGLGLVIPGAEHWVGIIHGWLYLAYVIVAVDLWFRTGKRLDVVRMIGVVLAGTIPFASFVAERWVRPRVLLLIAQDERDQAQRSDGTSSEPSTA